MGDAVQVTTTVESAEAAERIGRVLLDERLAACIQIQGPITSIYRWQGAVEQAAEWYCHVKTMRVHTDAVIARIRALHSYDTPEVIAVPLTAVLPAYAAWIAAQTTDAT